MACYNASPYTCTYDSGGGKDYTAFGTFEIDSDNDLAGYSGPVILNCYDSQVHDDYIRMDGSTNTSNTVHRKIQSAPGCSVIWSGKSGTGANFYVVNSIASNVFYSNEPYAVFKNLAAKIVRALAGTLCCFSNYNGSGGSKYLNCLAYESSNTTDGQVAGGIYFSHISNNTVIAYNCIVRNCSGRGYYHYALYGTEFNASVCCTAISCSGGGFYTYGASGTAIVYSCYAANNTGVDFRESYWDAPSGWNASKDNTADLGGGAGNNYKNGLDLSLDADGFPVNATNLYGSAGTGENWGRNPYDDFVAVSDLLDFLKNDTSGWTESKKDIRGTDRPTPDTADVSWAVGAAEYVEPSPLAGGSDPMMWIF